MCVCVACVVFCVVCVCVCVLQEQITCGGKLLVRQNKHSGRHVLMQEHVKINQAPPSVDSMHKSQVPQKNLSFRNTKRLTKATSKHLKQDSSLIHFLSSYLPPRPKTLPPGTVASFPPPNTFHPLPETLLKFSRLSTLPAGSSSEA